MGETVRRALAVSLVAITAAAAAAQQAPQTPVDGGERVIVYGMVPIPDVGEGAPQFTAKDVDAMEEAARKTMADTRSDTRRCSNSPLIPVVSPTAPPSMVVLLAHEFEAAMKVANMADRAYAVTLAAEASRRDAASGAGNMQIVEQRELERQEAVNKLQEARAELFEVQAMIGDFQDMMRGERRKTGIAWSDLDMRALNRKKDGVGLNIAMPNLHPGLDIQNVVASQHKDRKGKDMVVVRGDIVNTGAKSATIPELFVALVDEQGWTLTNTTVSPPPFQKGIGAGKRKAFQVEVRPAPEALKTAVVTFAAKHAVEPRMGVSLFCGGALAF
jgi:hypothetical protein